METERDAQEGTNWGKKKPREVWSQKPGEAFQGREWLLMSDVTCREVKAQETSGEHTIV